MQEYLGVNTPVAGFMRAEDVYHGHAELRFADFIRPAVECEVAVRLARDLPPGPCSLEQALAAAGDFFAGVEIVENRYGELKDLGMPTLVADQMYHCAAVIGDRHEVDWRPLDIGALRGRISLDSGTTDEGFDVGPAGSSSQRASLAGGVGRGGGVRRPESRASYHAGQRYSARLVERTRCRHGVVPAVAEGDCSTGLIRSAADGGSRRSA